MVRSSIITTTGPLVLSGFAAGVSVEGPIASVSARVRLIGGAGFVVDAAAGNVLGAGMVSVVCGTMISAGAELVSSGSCVVVLVVGGAVTAGGNVFISTGLDDNASCVFSDLDPAATCGGLLCAAVDECSALAEAMAADATSSKTSTAIAIAQRPGSGGQTVYERMLREDAAKAVNGAAKGEVGIESEVNVSAVGSWIDGKRDRARLGRGSGTAPCSPQSQTRQERSAVSTITTQSVTQRSSREHCLTITEYLTVLNHRAAVRPMQHKLISACPVRISTYVSASTPGVSPLHSSSLRDNWSRAQNMRCSHLPRRDRQIHASEV
mgnify:CR=1 FL=1